MKLIVNTSRLKKNYKKLSQLGKIYYPLKANSEENVLKQLSSIGVKNCLTSSINMYNANSSMCENVSVINTLLDNDSLIELYRKGIKSFVFDNLIKLNSFISLLDNTEGLEISIKLSLNSIYYSKLNTGADYEERKLMEELLISIGINYGYSIYINKAIRHKVKLRNIIEILKTDKRLETTDRYSFISIGGIDESNISLFSELRDVISCTNIEFRIEPGEILLSNAIDCEANIIATSRFEHNINVHIDLSTYVELYDVAALNKQIKVESISNKKVTTEGLLSINIFGNSSDSNDYFGTVYINDDINITVGDKIVLKDVGAYFNRAKHI